jgi:hypothetical protein
MSWWEMSEESFDVATPRSRSDAPAATKAPAIREWWQLSEENSKAATPRGHENGAPGHSWSRIRTPSPERLHHMSEAGSSQFPVLPLPAQQWRAPYPEAPVVMAMPVPPPPPQPLLLADVLGCERADGAQASSDRASQRQLRREVRQEEQLRLCGPAESPGQARGDGHVLSIGSVGHPHSCGLPCKYSRGSRVCKDAAACRRCHVCPWRRSEERARAAEERARVQQ